ncbi:MAG: hypothetical protein KTR31_26875 [Myxococcales bacterium]|nr:hypothetical protein [Myxococcales bacterium]
MGPASQHRPLWLACFAWACTSGPPQQHGPYTSWADPVSSALRLGIEGLDAREGHLWFLTQSRCAPLLLETGTCYGANPLSPYGMFVFPEDGGLPADDLPAYQLEQHEAILFVGHTPPASRYFSFNHHQYRKALPGQPDPITFATLAPSLHLLDLRTDPAVHAPESEPPFGQYTTVLFAANATTVQRVRTLLTPALAHLGLEPERINVHPMAYRTPDDAEALVASGQLAESDAFSLTMGDGPDADTYSVVLRVAAPTEPTDRYFDPAEIEAAVFKLTLDEAPAYDPLPWPTFPPPDDTSETEGARLQQALEAVAQAVIDEIVPPIMEVRTMEMPSQPQRSGAHCINLLDTCAANNDDARYHRTPRRVIAADRSVASSVFVVGVNHTEAARLDPTAPRTTYSSITLNNFSRSVGVVARIDSELRGSLTTWFDADRAAALTGLSHESLDSLYVVQFSHDCTAFDWESRLGHPNPHCIEFDDDVLGVCPMDKFWFTERVYLNQTTGTAPSASSVIPPKVLMVAPSVSWAEQEQLGGVGGAWALGEIPEQTPEEGDWCLPPGQRP